MQAHTINQFLKIEGTFFICHGKCDQQSHEKKKKNIILQYIRCLTRLLPNLNKNVYCTCIVQRVRRHISGIKISSHPVAHGY